MVIDTSAIMAILLGEVDAEIFARAVANETRVLISAFTVFETGIVIEVRKGVAGAREWELLQYRAGIESVPFTSAQNILAMEGWRRYGKGRHPAALNIGDCCSYSLAKLTGEPLLYKGNDFAQTDVVGVM